MNLPLLRLHPIYPGQWGVPGSDNELGIRSLPQSTVLYVDYDNAAANDNNDGTDPNFPLSTVQEAVDKVCAKNLDHSVIVVRSMTSESVVTPAYTDAPSYVKIVGMGRYSPSWASDNAALPCLDLRCVGWTVENFRFLAPTGASCIELRHTDTGANDISIRTQIKNCYFDGQTTGLAGIITHGAYDVWIVDNFFSLFHNAGGTATALLTGTTPLAIPYRNHVIGNTFMDNDNNIDMTCNGSRFMGNVIQATGYAYTATVNLRTNLIASPGDDNIVTGNFFEGDYSNAGGYISGANDMWVGNIAEDTAEAEVGDNGITIAIPDA